VGGRPEKVGVFSWELTLGRLAQGSLFKGGVLKRRSSGGLEVLPWGQERDGSCRRQGGNCGWAKHTKICSGGREALKKKEVHLAGGAAWGYSRAEDSGKGEKTKGAAPGNRFPGNKIKGCGGGDRMTEKKKEKGRGLRKDFERSKRGWWTQGGRSGG